MIFFFNFIMVCLLISNSILIYISFRGVIGIGPPLLGNLLKLRHVLIIIIIFNGSELKLERIYPNNIFVRLSRKRLTN